MNLMFVDDVLIFGQSNRKVVVVVKVALKTFTSFAGMAINQRKSILVLLVACTTQMKLKFEGILNILVVSFSIKYLGLPLALGKLKHSNCGGLLASLEKMLSRW